MTYLSLFSGIGGVVNESSPSLYNERSRAGVVTTRPGHFTTPDEGVMQNDSTIARKVFSEETRRRMSEAAKLRCTPEWRANKSRQYTTAIDGEKLRELYEGGMTKAEVAAALNVTPKVIHNAMKRHGIKVRKAIKRNQRGENNSSWRGSDATYSAMHHRVEVYRGKPSLCEKCGCTEGRFEWANLSGDYSNVQDYSRLCVPCHRQHDSNLRREVGKPLSSHIRRRRGEVQNAS